MPKIITQTSPNEEGEILWVVHYKSSYYDNDPRMPGTVPIDSRSYVLARSRDEAIAKAVTAIKKARCQKDKKAKEEIEATVVTIEDLIPARVCSNDGRLGFVSTQRLSEIGLSHPDDSKRYRLGVCLIPIE